MLCVGRLGHHPIIRRGAAVVFVLSSLVLLTSCNMVTVGQSVDGSNLDITDKVKSIDLSSRQPQPVGVAGATGGSNRAGTAAIYEGTDVTAGCDDRPQPTPSGNGFDLNFENTPVATVAKVVLGDIMQTGYTIDPRVQGTVSLVSVRPVPKSDIIFVLENALRISGVVLVRDTTGYRLTPLGDAIGAGHVDSAGNTEPGYGVSVVPLQYISAQTLLKLMDSFATKPGVVRADTGRNLLLIQGTGPERLAAVEAAMSFDVDWMRGQSIGIFPIVNSGPEPVIAELEKIVDSGENGFNQNLIKFQAIARLNAIMVVSKKPALLNSAATWIKRLDRSDNTRNSVHVYRIKYGEAKQIAPGSGASGSGGDRLAQNGNNNTSSPPGGFGSRLTPGSGTGFGAAGAVA